MLTRLAVSGFKAIKDSGNVSLGDLTLFIGRNASGKSSLLEALQWLQEATLSGLDAATSRRFHAHEDLLNRRSTEMGIHIAFDAGAKEVRYHLEVQGSGGRLVVTKETCSEGRTRGTTVTIRSRKGQRGPSVRSISGGNPVRDGDALALASATKTNATGAERLLHYLRRAVFLRLSPTLMAQGGRIVRSARGPLLDEEGKQLTALLSEMSDEQRTWVGQQIAGVIQGVEDLKVVRRADEGHFALRERMLSRGGKRAYDIPSWMLSEGTRRLTAIFALLAVRPRPSLIAIEEVENGLDPWTLRYVLDALRDVAADGVQILLTTHSPFLLDHVDPEEVIHVRREHGDSVYEPITSFDEVVRNQGVIAPGAMYLAGYLRDAEGS